MPYKLPKELTEADWKKHKATLVKETGVSTKLRDLVPVAAAYDEGDDASIKALDDALRIVKQAAQDSAKDLSKAFAKTKEYLVKMGKAAQEAQDKITDDKSQRNKSARAKEVAQEEQRQREATEVLVAASRKTPKDFLAALDAQYRILGMNLGQKTKVELALKDRDASKIHALLQDADVKVPLGPLMLLCKES